MQRVSDELYAEWKRWCVGHAEIDQSAEFQLGIAQDFDDAREALRIATEALEEIALAAESNNYVGASFVVDVVDDALARIRGEGVRDE